MRGTWGSRGEDREGRGHQGGGGASEGLRKRL